MTTAPEAPPLPGEGAAIEFTGRRAPVMWLLLINSLLTVMSIGIYRFWAKTRIRRYFWSHVRIRGDALEYLGLPSELFIGFLIAIAVLVPVGSVYATFNALLGPEDALARTVLEFANLIVLLTLFQVAFYRMWRYRLTRTAWRGIRFGLDGSTWHYLWLSSVWLVLVLLTLGLAYPWMQVALWRYRVSHTRIGSTYFGFSGEAMPLLLPWLVVYAIPAALLALTAAVSSPEPAIAAAIATPFAYLWYRIRQGRYLIGHTRLGRGRFGSRLAVAPLLLAFLAVGVCLGAPIRGHGDPHYRRHGRGDFGRLRVPCLLVHHRLHRPVACDHRRHPALRGGQAALPDHGARRSGRARARHSIGEGRPPVRGRLGRCLRRRRHLSGHDRVFLVNIDPL